MATQSDRRSRRTAAWLLLLALAFVCGLVWWRFEVDIRAARARAASGAVTVNALVLVQAMLDNILPVSARAEGLRNEAWQATHLEPYELGAIGAPTLLISARDDGYGTYASAEYAASRIPGAKFIGYERGGHMLVGHDAEVMRAILVHMQANARH